ncbi:MerR family transcriptional regulator [Solwaraspora sp. WMMB335]|uniref:MerR family transcriptional regulator n=1 Tax=Solwaraspora sp. WMMB335 TaxID=3404118 RepID=UPI003B953B76
MSPTTLRSWHQRYGLGPSGHQAGRHRRYTSHDVAVLTLMARLTAHGLPAAEAAQRARREAAIPSVEHPRGDRSTHTVARGLARAARRLDVLSVREALILSVSTYGVLHTWHTLVGPAFTQISRARYSEPRKTLARRVLARCLTETFAMVPRPPAGSPVRVLLVAVDHRRDTVALDALAAAVVVWSHAWSPGVCDLLTALTGTPGWRPTIIAGGQGWPPHGGPSPTPTVACRNLASAVATVARLAGDRAG